MKLDPGEIKKIVVFRALQLGDMLCSIPALRALHRSYPEASITLLGMPWAHSLTRRFPNYIHSFRHFPGYPGLPEQKFDARIFTKFLQDMQEEQFDLVLQMQGNGSIVNPMVELFGAKHTAGFCLAGDYCRDKEFFLEYPEGIHEIERHLKLMEHLGIPPAGVDLEFPLYEDDWREHDAMHLPVKAHEYVCVHPGSRGAWRQWPPRYFANLADECSKAGFQIVITGTKEEIPIIEEVTANLEAVPFIAAGQTSLGAVAALIKNASALLSNCTGVSHIAAAMKTPGIVISMDGEPERWGPLDKRRHRTIDWLQRPSYDEVKDELHDLLQSL